MSMVAIALVTHGYEYLKYRVQVEEHNKTRALAGSESAGVLSFDLPHATRRSRCLDASLYASQVAYSFTLMLVFMTYNGWLMLSVLVGAASGHYFWGIPEARSMACH